MKKVIYPTAFGRACGRGGITALFLAGALGFFILFALFNLGKPFSSDEHWFVIAAHGYAASGALSPETLIHPPLYTLINGVLLGTFKNPAILKLWGMALGLGGMALMFLLGPASGAGRSRSSLAALLLGMSPLFIQGSLMLDTDNTLVTFFLLAMLLALFKERWFFFCVAFLMCIWSKITAALPIFLVFSAWAAWDIFEGRRRGAAVFISLVAGLALFLVSFRFFCWHTGLSFRMPFEYLYSSFILKRISGGGAFFRQVLQFSIWTGLPMCLLWLGGAARAVRAGKRNLDTLAVLFSVVIGAGYFFVGGTPFGFPKMQVPAFTLGCWLASGLILEAVEDLCKRPLFTAACLLAGASLIVASGDPIYTLRFAIRSELAAGHAISASIGAFAAQVSFQLILGGVFWLLLRKTSLPAGRAAIASAALACFSQFIGMDILQTRAHNTLYTYGATGMEEAVNLAASALKNGGKAALPLEITGYLNLKGFNLKMTSNKFWADAGAVSAAVSDPEYKVIIYGAPFNTLEQMRLLTGRETAASLAANGWACGAAGSYEIWTRKMISK
jgi:hypothetical protein